MKLVIISGGWRIERRKTVYLKVKEVNYIQCMAWGSWKTAGGCESWVLRHLLRYMLGFLLEGVAGVDNSKKI